MSKIALVTGANRGIGLEVCHQLLQRGYSVVLGARDLAKGEAAAQRLQGSVIAKQLDVTQASDVDAIFAWLQKSHGKLHALINNAGVDYDTDQQVLNADLDRVRKTWEINTLGAWRAAQAMAPLLIASGEGRLVNVSSGAGQLDSLGARTPAYSHSKVALNGLTLMLHSALHSRGVLVNAVCPGWVATDMGGAGGRPIEEGAQGVVWAATLPNGGPSGRFFRDGQEQPW